MLSYDFWKKPLTGLELYFVDTEMSQKVRGDLRALSGRLGNRALGRAESSGSEQGFNRLVSVPCFVT